MASLAQVGKLPLHQIFDSLEGMAEEANNVARRFGELHSPADLDMLTKHLQQISLYLKAARSVSGGFAPPARVETVGQVVDESVPRAGAIAPHAEGEVPAAAGMPGVPDFDPLGGEPGPESPLGNPDASPPSVEPPLVGLDGPPTPVDPSVPRRGRNR